MASIAEVVIVATELPRNSCLEVEEAEATDIDVSRTVAAKAASLRRVSWRFQASSERKSAA